MARAGTALMASSNRGTKDNYLYRVSCVSSSFCMAAGDASDGSHLQTLIEKW
jgi:hypothetical protein